MEAWDAIRARRNVRQYTPVPVSEDDLNRIAEAGWLAPLAKTARRGTLSLSPIQLSYRNFRRSGRVPVISQVPRPRSHSSCRYRPVSAGR
jgi:nitroreductase